MPRDIVFCASKQGYTFTIYQHATGLQLFKREAQQNLFVSTRVLIISFL